MLRSTVFTAILMMGVAGTAAAQTGNAAEGEKLYAAQKCSICHAINGKGNVKGPLDGVGSRLTADEIRQWLVDPKAMTEKTKAARKPMMTSYAKLPKEQIDHLVAYVLTLKKQ
jgi:mono/diheme cytochrome c family protein